MTATWLLLLCSALPGAAQDIPSDSSAVADTTLRDAPLVYIDCERCDYNHVRREVTLVNYVRDPARADVHVFITDERTGGGGREYELSFIGRRSFSDLDYSFTYGVDRNATWDEEREGLNQVLAVGLAPYVVQTVDATTLAVSYATPEGADTRREVDDPWNHWVFNIYAGDLETGIESNRWEFDSRWGFYADRVTDTWKTRIRPYFNFDYVEIDQEDAETITSRIHRHGVNTFAIRSVNAHWSLGYFGDYLTRNDRNFKHRVRVQPGVEYSLLPYEVATRVAITFRYRIGLSRAVYYEETIFGKTEEVLFNQQVEASARIRQPWGRIFTGLSGSHYFHDFARRRAVFYGNVSVRLIEGLSIDFEADFEMIQDQLSLPRGDTSVEDILLEQRELATDFQFSGSIGLSYTFGSQYASVVNTRF